MPIQREHLVERQGRTFVLYAGLLNEAHEQGLSSIRTHLLQIPSQNNGETAICFAEVTTSRGIFTGVGDANPDNVGRVMVPHIIRLAETRAKARALRDAVNIGMAALEELGPDPDDEPRVPTPISSRSSQPDGPATGAQLNAIASMCHRFNLNRDHILAEAGATFDTLTARQAAAIITQIQGNRPARQ